MALTEEQRERMRISRERALEIKRRRAEEKERREAAEAEAEATGGGDEEETNTDAKNKGDNDEEGDDDDGDNVELEDFEVGASPHVTKAEATQKYCLPEGTLAVCAHIEKPNPRRGNWAPMKLYFRKEIRRRARERWGGLEGLREERARREQRRFERDMEGVGQVFKRQKS